MLPFLVYREITIRKYSKYGGDGHLPEWNFVGEGEDLSDPSVESENSFQAETIKIRYLTSLLTAHVGLK